MYSETEVREELKFTQSDWNEIKKTTCIHVSYSDKYNELFFGDNELRFLNNVSYFRHDHGFKISDAIFFAEQIKKSKDVFVLIKFEFAKVPTTLKNITAKEMIEFLIYNNMKTVIPHKNISNILNQFKLEDIYLNKYEVTFI